MRVPHFRVRTLMAAVAVLALLLWGGMMAVVSSDYSRRAGLYAADGAHWRDLAARGRWDPRVALECADYLEALARKYRRAAWRPWQPVAPDPHAPGYDRWVEQERRAKGAAPVP